MARYNMAIKGTLSVAEVRAAARALRLAGRKLPSVGMVVRMPEAAPARELAHDRGGYYWVGYKFVGGKPRAARGGAEQLRGEYDMLDARGSVVGRFTVRGGLFGLDDPLSVLVAHDGVEPFNDTRYAATIREEITKRRLRLRAAGGKSRGAGPVRVRSDRLYVRRVTKGTSGFQQWGEYDHFVVPPGQARSGHRTEIVGEYLPDANDEFQESFTSAWTGAPNVRGTDLTALLLGPRPRWSSALHVPTPGHERPRTVGGPGGKVRRKPGEYAIIDPRTGRRTWHRSRVGTTTKVAALADAVRKLTR